MVNWCNWRVELYIAPAEVAEDMKTMLQKVETAAVEFMSTHIIGAERNMHSPRSKKTKLQTVSIVGKKVTSKSKKGELADMKNSKTLLAKMLLLQKVENYRWRKY